MTDIFTQDIALTPDLQARVTANGELLLTDGPDTGVQDIWLAIVTYAGTLFYDTAYGSRIPDSFYTENTTDNRLKLIGEVKRSVRQDRRVASGSERCAILAWDHTGITLEASWRFISLDHRYNLVFRVDEDRTIKLEQVIADVRPEL